MSNIIGLPRISIFLFLYYLRNRKILFGSEEKEAFPRHVRVLKHKETNRNGDQSGNEISNDAFPHHVRVLGS